MRLDGPLPLVVPLPNGTEEISGEEVVFSIREVRSSLLLPSCCSFGFLFLRDTNSLVRPICRFVLCFDLEDDFVW